jgi:hypothetical protein
VNFVEYETNTRKNHNIVKRRFMVAGGHGLCNKNFVTPQGVVTVVEDEDTMNWLNSLDSFKRSIDRGYIRVTKRREDPEKIVKKDMNLRDGSSPKTPKDYKVVDGAIQSYTVN